MEDCRLVCNCWVLRDKSFFKKGEISAVFNDLGNIFYFSL